MHQTDRILLRKLVNRFGRVLTGLQSVQELLVFLVALVLANVAPRPLWLTQSVAISNFWWQLGAVGGLTALALFCGWLQGVLGWTPEEVSFATPAQGPGHGHT